MTSIKRILSPTKNNDIQKKQKLSAETNGNFDYLFEDDNDFNFCDFDIKAVKNVEDKLDLSNWQRCVVVEVNRDIKSFHLVLHVKSEKNENVSLCYLSGPWASLDIDINDIVSILAKWDDHLNGYLVDKDYGFCVTNPDTLISGTTVVGSLFCRRKAVLQEKFRGVDLNNKVMVIGTLVHELFQTVLTKGLKTYEEINEAAKNLLQSQETAYTLYSSELTQEETESEVKKFSSNILSFVQQYVAGRETTVQLKDNFPGRITEIKDIEENLWIPQLGLKGKIDVSVKIHKTRNNTIKWEKSKNNAIPLELKTGRATMSMEHKGQLLLYQMMLTAIGRETTSGLLLYLREGILREISSGRNEQRDLIILRNELSRYSNQQLPKSISSNEKFENDKFLQPLELPEPISHHSACNSCAYSTICCTFAKTDPDIQLRDNHPLKKVMTEVTNHLTSKDFEYFIYWCGLLALEEHESKKSNYIRTLWTEVPEMRQQQGRAILDLKLHEDAIFEESRYIQSFKIDITKAENCESVDLRLSGFSIGEYVIVSTRKRLAIAAGCIQELDSKTISINLERNLHENYADETFIIDKHESQSGNVFNFTNLGLLLDNTEQSNKLRSIIIAKEIPTFCKSLPKQIKSENGILIFKKMNAVQRVATLAALTTESYMLIKGLPGTGKTQTIIGILRLLNLIGKKVIVTSHTHSAVDNILLRLREYNIPMIRLGSDKRINPLLHAYSESELMKDCNTESELANKYASFHIVGVTCLGAGHSMFSHQKFDYCIVDEATQVTQSTILRPLFFSNKFILVGDPEQLPPLIKSNEARKRGADESLFKRLDSEIGTSVLTLQYRMNETITKLANDLTYEGALQCGSDEVKNATIALKMKRASYGADKWLEKVLHSDLEMSVFLLDTGDCSDRSNEFAQSKHSHTCAVIEQSFAEDIKLPLDKENSSPIKQQQQEKKNLKRRISKYTNYCDAVIVLHITKKLLECGYEADRIGIIAPYRAQVELLRKLLEQYHNFYNDKEENINKEKTILNFKEVEINTVDQYQGRDKDIILYSCSKTGTQTSNNAMERSKEAEILEDKRRLTVAITRAKKKLILIGDTKCLQQYTPFRLLLSHIPSTCRLQLIDGTFGFNWQSLFKELTEIISD